MKLLLYCKRGKNGLQDHRRVSIGFNRTLSGQSDPSDEENNRFRPVRECDILPHATICHTSVAAMSPDLQKRLQQDDGAWITPLHPNPNGLIIVGINFQRRSRPL